MTIPDDLRAIEEANMGATATVAPDGDGWSVVVAYRPWESVRDSVHKTQKEAVARARKVLEEHEAGGDLVVHKQDGTVRDSTAVAYNHGNDR